MERYNLLIIPENPEGELPEDWAGLRVIQTNTYSLLLQQNPELIHQNCGDFYSEVPLNELSDTVYNVLDKERLTELGDFIVVEREQLGKITVSTRNDYLIKEADGIRLYCPSLHSGIGKCNKWEIYGFVALYFIEDLFSDKKEGSLQRQVKTLEEELKEIDDEIETMKEKLNNKK